MNKITANKAQATKAPAVKAQATKAPAPAVKATKAPAVKAQAPAPALVTGDNILQAISRIEVLHSMVVNLNDRLAQTEAVNASLVSQCETLERIIIGIQTAQAQAPAKKAPAVKAQATKAPAFPLSLVELLPVLAECVRVNAAADFFNEKILPQTDNDLRVYLHTAENKALKAARTEAGLSLVDVVNMLDAEVNG